jgi:hypothetical protein
LKPWQRDHWTPFLYPAEAQPAPAHVEALRARLFGQRILTDAERYFTPAPAIPEGGSGVAAKLETWFEPDDGSLAESRRRGARLFVCLERHCLDKSLRQIQRGLARFSFRIDHDPRQVLARSTDPDVLAICRSGNTILFAVGGARAAGRAALLDARASGRAQLSLGLRDLEGIRWTNGRVVYVSVTRARVAEVSLVHEGAIPGTRFAELIGCA